jgi:hypothetical protein
MYAANEVKGKSSNQAYAAREANRILVDEKGLDISFMTISSVDADSIFDEQYFAYLTHEFLRHKNRDLAFFHLTGIDVIFDDVRNSWRRRYLGYTAHFGRLTERALAH